MLVRHRRIFLLGLMLLSAVASFGAASASRAQAAIVLPADSYGEQGLTAGQATKITPPASKVDSSTTEGAKQLSVSKVGFTGERCRRSGRQRVCTLYSFGTAYRVCTYGGGHRKRCRTLRSTASDRPTAGASRIASIATASVSATTPYGFRSPLPAVGKIFRKNAYEGNTPGEAVGACSGTLIANGLLITAAHCLYQTDTDAAEVFASYPGQGGSFPDFLIKSEELLFVPDASATGSGTSGATNVSAPYGVLKITQTWVPSCWHEGHDDGGCDYGIAQIAPYTDGTYAGEKVGAFPLLWDYTAPAGTGYYQMGYPASGSFVTQQYGWGDSPTYCQDIFNGDYKTSSNSSGDAALIGTGYYIENPNCFMNGGASGGPVFTEYNGTWFVAGVNNIGGPQGAAFGENMAWNWWGSGFGSFVCEVAPGVCQS